MYPWVWDSASQTQQTADRKQHFQSTTGNITMWRADCLDCSMPYRIMDLSVFGVWYPRGSWNESSMDTEEWL